MEWLFVHTECQNYREIDRETWLQWFYRYADIYDLLPFGVLFVAVVA